MMRRIVLGGSLAFAAMTAATAEAPKHPTFTKDVLPIVQENCQECHRPKPIAISGLVAPFALTSYEEARPWAKAIAEAVANRNMPPWFASDEFHGTFRNERTLTQDEIDTIVRWVESGAPRGNPSDAPNPIEFSDKEWWLGEPDLIVPLPEKIWVGDEVDDWQPMIPVKLTEEQLPKDRWLKSLEAQADADCVHHIVIYSTNPHQAPRTEAGGQLGYGNIGGLAPGAVPSLMQDGYGILLQKNAVLRFSMHYHKEPGPGTGEYDQSRIGLFFYDEDEVVKPINIEPIGELGFEIPPNTENYVVTADYTFDRAFKILNYLPHMHLRGVAAKYTAHFPDGSTETLLSVPRYNYNWQLYYEYPEPRDFPAGTRIQVDMTFDNSTGNPSNPDPNKTVRFGASTTDEMALGWMAYTWADDASASD